MADREKLAEMLFPIIGMRSWSERIADHLIANGVTVRERGRWEDVSLRFTQVKEKCSVCGADMR